MIAPLPRRGSLLFVAIPRVPAKTFVLVEPYVVLYFCPLALVARFLAPLLGGIVGGVAGGALGGRALVVIVKRWQLVPCLTCGPALPALALGAGQVSGAAPTGRGTGLLHASMAVLLASRRGRVNLVALATLAVAQVGATGALEQGAGLVLGVPNHQRAP